MITLWLATGALSAPQVDKPSTLTQGGSGGARKRWRVKIGDVVYSTYEEDWFDAVEAPQEPVEVVEPVLKMGAQPVQPAWRGLPAEKRSNVTADKAEYSARLAAIQTQHALERAYLELKAAETNAELSRWQDSLTRAQQAMVNARLEAQRKAEAARRDDEEALLALMFMN